MIGILLVTHNGLGESLVDCVRHVLGSTPPNVKVLSVLAQDEPERKLDEGRRLLAQLEAGSGVLLLSDLYGSTPCNIAQRLCQREDTVGIAGVNLPMLLRAVNYSDRPLQEVAQKVLDIGRSCVLPINPESGSCDAATGSTDH